jgi:hypothetical protein
MTVGALLVGIAVLGVVAAYVARPFRSTRTAPSEQTIETWIARTRGVGEELERERQQRVTPEPTGSALVVNYCRQCGQRVDEADRFCSGCGTPLRSQRD